MKTAHPLTHAETELRALASRLHRIARDIDDTATGSSRVSMYNALANAIRDEATTVLTLVGDLAKADR